MISKLKFKLDKTAEYIAKLKSEFEESCEKASRNVVNQGQIEM